VPNIKSAKKRVLVIEKKSMENKMIISAVKTAIKKINVEITAGKATEATNLLSATFAQIDSAVSKGVIHKNNAANKKSAIAKKINALKNAPASNA
jgi:small subunit ribosomal protein S20